MKKRKIVLPVRFADDEDFTTYTLTVDDATALPAAVRKWYLDAVAHFLLDAMVGDDFRYLIGRLQELLPTAFNTDQYQRICADLATAIQEEGSLAEEVCATIGTK